MQTEQRNSLRLLQWMMAASLALPIALFAFASAVSWVSIRDTADREVERTLDVAYEHALKVFETIDRSLSEINEIIRGIPDADITEERRLRYVDAISDTVSRAAKLIAQLLAFARRQTLKPEVFDVGKSVRTLTEMIGTLTGSPIQIITRVPDQPCFINADAGQLETALINMAVNARDAMGGAGHLKEKIEEDAPWDQTLSGGESSGSPLRGCSCTTPISSYSMRPLRRSTPRARTK